MNELLMHTRGGREVTKDELDLIALPQATDSYQPVSHFELANTLTTIGQDTPFRKQMEDAGNEEFQLKEKYQSFLLFSNTPFKKKISLNMYTASSTSDFSRGFVHHSYSSRYEPP